MTHADEPRTTHGSVEQAIEEIRAGKFVIVADDEDRENEGDLVCAAQLVTPEMINFMIRRAGGLICVALTGERVDQLGLAPMSETNRSEERRVGKEGRSRGSPNH